VATASRGGSDDPLLVHRDGAIETLVINDAPRNRMSLAFLDALEKRSNAWRVIRVCGRS